MDQTPSKLTASENDNEKKCPQSDEMIFHFIDNLVRKVSGRRHIRPVSKNQQELKKFKESDEYMETTELLAKYEEETDSEIIDEFVVEGNPLICFHPASYKVEERLKEIANPCGLPLPSIFQQDFDIDEALLRSSIHPSEIAELEGLIESMLTKYRVNLPEGLTRPNSLLYSLSRILAKRHEQVIRDLTPLTAARLSHCWHGKPNEKPHEPKTTPAIKTLAKRRLSSNDDAETPDVTPAKRKSNLNDDAEENEEPASRSSTPTAKIASRKRTLSASSKSTAITEETMEVEEVCEGKEESAIEKDLVERVDGKKSNKSREEGSLKKHACEKCDKSFAYPSHLRLHMHTHTGDAEKPFSCDKCDKSFTYLSLLQRHSVTHTGDRPFSCPFSSTCQSAYTQLEPLNRHVTKIHGGNPFTMQTWHAKLKRNAELTKRSIQIQKVESDEVESSGPQIKRMKPTIDYAEDSEQSAIEDAAEDEEDESDESRTVGGMKKPIKCRECGKSFKFAYKLRNHMYTHTDPRSFHHKPASCQECDKSFLFAYELRIHMKTHTGERPFPCTICPGAFKTSKECAMHVRVVHRGKPYTCKTCGARFDREKPLTHHNKTNSCNVNEKDDQENNEARPAAENDQPGLGTQSHGRSSEGIEENMDNEDESDEPIEEPNSTEGEDAVEYSEPSDDVDVNAKIEMIFQRNNSTRRSIKVAKLKEMEEDDNENEDSENINEVVEFNEMTKLKDSIEGNALFHIGNGLDDEKEMGLSKAVGKKPFPCEKCDDSFHLECLLRIHVARTHTVFRPFLCRFVRCCVAYTNTDDLNEHYRTEHNEQAKEQARRRLLSESSRRPVMQDSDSEKKIDESSEKSEAADTKEDPMLPQDMKTPRKDVRKGLQPKTMKQCNDSAEESESQEQLYQRRMSTRSSIKMQNVVEEEKDSAKEEVDNEVLNTQVKPNSRILRSAQERIHLESPRQSRSRSRSPNLRRSIRKKEIPKRLTVEIEEPKRQKVQKVLSIKCARRTVKERSSLDNVVKENTKSAIEHFCPHCDQTFDTVLKWKRHQKIEHPSEPFECMKCGGSFESSAAFLEHDKEGECTRIVEEREEAKKRSISDDFEEESEQCEIGLSESRRISESVVSGDEEEKEENESEEEDEEEEIKERDEIKDESLLDFEQDNQETEPIEQPRSRRFSERNAFGSEDKTIESRKITPFIAPALENVFEKSRTMKNEQSQRRRGMRDTEQMKKTLNNEIEKEEVAEDEEEENGPMNLLDFTENSQDSVVDSSEEMEDKNEERSSSASVKKQFACDKCDKSFDILRYFRKHMRTHTDERSFHCTRQPNCSAFKNAFNLLRHIRNVHKENPFACATCDEEFDLLEELVDHKKNNADCAEQELTCTFDANCRKTFKRSQHLFRHLRKVHGTKPYECHKCKERFDQKPELYAHKISVNCAEQLKYEWDTATENNQYPAEDSEDEEDEEEEQEESTVTKSRRSQGVGATISCPFTNCSSTFSTNWNLKEHIIRSHSTISYRCEICDQEFAVKRVFITHKKNCSRRTEVQGEQVISVMETSGKIDKTSFEVDSDDKEKDSGIAKKAPRVRGSMKASFQCDFCVKSFIRPSELRDHRHAHTGERPHRCKVRPDCTSAFATSYELQKHIRAIHNEKPHQCDICKLKFNFLKELRQHSNENNCNK